MTVQAIGSTGLRGFMKWLQQDQPAVYAATAAKIAKAAPKGFSGFNGSALRAALLRSGRRSMQLRGYGGLGCCGIQSVGTCSATCGTSAINWGTCTSCAANTGATTGTCLTGIANIINSVAGAALTVQQQSEYSSLVQQQLGRAQAGSSPLTISSSSAGVPLIGGLSGTGSVLLLVGGAGVLLYLLSRK
jgi:hypothetical protein